MDMLEAAALYRLLGEAVRLRLLRVLARERLNVTELTAVLGLAQSGVSRHLGLLRDAGLVAEEPAGGFTFYRLDAAATDGRLASLWTHLQAQFDQAGTSAAARADDARLQEVLRQRRENFETHGTDAGQLVPGRSWPPGRAPSATSCPARGGGHRCGDGHLAIEAATGRGGYAIDRSAAVSSGPAPSPGSGAANIVWKRGEIERVPLPDASVDGPAPRPSIRGRPASRWPRPCGSSGRRPPCSSTSGRTTSPG
jgi:ArsR family transcriptional regulator